MPDADLDIVLKGSVFAAAGTCGQRCTTLRRMIVHESVYNKLSKAMCQAYESLKPKIGDPLDPNTLVGPLHSKIQVEQYQKGLEEIEK